MAVAARAVAVVMGIVDAAAAERLRELVPVVRRCVSRRSEVLAMRACGTGVAEATAAAAKELLLWEVIGGKDRGDEQEDEEEVPEEKRNELGEGEKKGDAERCRSSSMF
jgi:hypothetical protein